MRNLDDGHTTVARPLRWPFRIRVSISPNGSLNDIWSISLPTGLGHARDLPCRCQFAQSTARQFEFAINKIASEVQWLDRNSTAREIRNIEEAIDGLHGQLAIVDRKVQQLALNHFTDIHIDDEDIEPQVAAKQLVSATGNYEWLSDPLGIGPEFEPQFSNEDMVLLREERRILGADIEYLDSSLPQLDDFPDPGELLQAHQDLSRFERLTLLEPPTPQLV